MSTRKMVTWCAGMLEEIVRIELVFDDEGAELIEELKLLTGIKTHKEFFNNAITLFDWAVLQELLKKKVASMDEEKKDYERLIMPSLQHAAHVQGAVRFAAIAKRRGEELTREDARAA